MKYLTHRQLSLITALLIFLSSSQAQTGWEVKSTPINDNFLDVRFFGKYGVVIGEKGIYYNTGGIDNPGLWKRYIIKNATADSLKLAATKFVQLAFNDQAPIFYAVGNDTVTHRAMLLRLNLSDSSYSFPFIGDVGTQLNSVAALYYAFYGSIVAVGNNGLLVSYGISNGAVYQSVFHQNTNLKTIYSRSANDYRVAIIAENDSMYVGSANQAMSVNYQHAPGIHITSVDGSTAYGDYITDGNSLYKAGADQSPIFLSSITNYKPLTLKFRTICSAVSGFVTFIGTNNGIYKLINQSTLEYQPSSQGKSINRIWFKQHSVYDTGYAVGNAGVLLKTIDRGGATKPIAQLNIDNGGCVNSNFTLDGTYGSGNSCEWYLDGQFLRNYCGSLLYYFNAAGTHDVKYIVTNASGLSDTATKTISITAKPNVNLPFTVSDSILCKTERVQVQVSNTQNGHQYQFIEQASGNTVGTVAGNGGTATLTSNFISTTGYYFLRAVNLTSGCSNDFTSRVFIKVEKTRSRFAADKMNITVGEKFNLFNISNEASTFQWTLNEDANITTSTAVNLQNIAYSSIGQKTLTLISTSVNGCRDTVTAGIVYVYNKPSPWEKCYSLAVNDSDFFYTPASYPATYKPTVLSDNGYLISGYGNKPFLKSRYGNGKQMPKSMASYMVKYSEDGAIKWMHYIDSLGSFTGTEKDAQGNIYVIGVCNTRAWYHFNNGDSLLIGMANSDTGTAETSLNGFLLKLDSTGKYLWHTVFDDPISYYTGRQVVGGSPDKIIVKNNQVIVTGTFYSSLSYERKNNLKKIYNVLDFFRTVNRFLVKVKPDGTLVWSSYVKHSVTNNIGKSGMDVDNNGNIFLVNDYEDGISFFDSDSTAVLSLARESGQKRSYLLKIDSTGHLLWNAKMQTQYQYGFLLFNNLVLDNAGNCYVTGQAYSSGQNYPLEITNSNGTVSISDTICGFVLVKINGNGLYRWSAGSQMPYYGYGTALVNSGKEIYACGSISNNGAPASTFTFTSTDAVKYSDVFHASEFFIVNYDTAGVFKRIAKSGDKGGGSINAAGIDLDTYGNFIVSGVADHYDGESGRVPLFNTTITKDRIDVFFSKLSADFCNSCETTTWKGSASTAWNDPLNWSCNGVPTSTSSVIIPAGVPNFPVITGGQSITLKMLTVMQGGIVTVQQGGSLTVLH